MTHTIDAAIMDNTARCVEEHTSFAHIHICTHVHMQARTTPTCHASLYYTSNSHQSRTNQSHTYIHTSTTHNTQHTHANHTHTHANHTHTQTLVFIDRTGPSSSFMRAAPLNRWSPGGVYHSVYHMCVSCVRYHESRL